MHTDPEFYLPKETEVHAMAPDSAAPCDAYFLLVPHNNLAEVRLPSDAVPGTASTTEIVVYTAQTFDMFSCMRAIAVQQSQVHRINGLVPRGGCSRWSLHIC